MSRMSSEVLASVFDVREKVVLVTGGASGYPGDSAWPSRACWPSAVRSSRSGGRRWK